MHKGSENPGVDSAIRRLRRIGRLVPVGINRESGGTHPLNLQVTIREHGGYAAENLRVQNLALLRLLLRQGHLVELFPGQGGAGIFFLKGDTLLLRNQLAGFFPRHYASPPGLDEHGSLDLLGGEHCVQALVGDNLRQSS